MDADLLILISYAHKDGVELAERLVSDLRQAGWNPWLDTARLVGGACWTAQLEKVIDESGLVLALLTTGSYQSDLCRAEQLRALRKGKRVIPLLAQSGSEIPLHLESKQYHDFSGLAPYGQQLENLLADLKEGSGGVPLRERFRQTYVTAPPLPRNYVERPRTLWNLRSVLITDGGGTSIALTALEGMGGIGKTVLAQALCHDDVVQQAFPDGVVWVTAGREPTYDLFTRMREVRRALNDQISAGETELECINRYRSVLRDKAALIVVDDVWASRDIEPFRAESPRSRILFTTRDATIAADVGAEEHVADLLTDDQSRRVLAQWAGFQTDTLPPEAADLVRECGRLPLALSMIGAMLRNKPREYWRRVLSLLRGAELAKIATKFPNYPHTDLFRAIQVSVDGLDTQSQDRYIALAVMLEDTPIPSAVQQVLWNTDELDALETAERFISLSLAQRDARDRGIRLHDIQLDYVRGRYANKEALRLIQGAVRLSSLVIDRDPYQFASQMTGRLLPHQNVPGLPRFTASATSTPGPFLRLLSVTLHPPGTGLVRTMEGHFGTVNHVAITPDGLRAVSGSWDDTVRVWDLESGRELHIMSGHSASVPCVDVSPDGRRAVSASEDDTLKVWDLESGREVRTLIGHSGSVNGVAITPDGRHILSASWDKTLRLWELDSGRYLRRLDGHEASVTSVAVMPEGRHAVSGSADSTLRVWDLDSGRPLRTLAGHADVVFGVAGCWLEPWVVSASRDGTLKVWDLESGRELRTLKGHSDFVYGVSVGQGSDRAVSASRDRTLRIWDLESGRELRTLNGHSASVTSVGISADGRRAVSASWDKTLKLWDLQTGPEAHTLAGHSRFVSSVSMSADGRRGVSACWDTTLKVWDPESGCELRTLVGHQSTVEAVAVSQDGRLAVSGSMDTTLKLWDIESGRELRTLRGHSNAVSAVALTRDARLIVSASRDNTVRVWDLESGREVRTLVGHSDGVTAVAISPDNRWAISASVDQLLKGWDLESGRELFTLRGHSKTVSGVAIAPDGHQAISASWDHTLKVWDLESSLNIRTLAGHTDSVSGLDLTSDGRLAISTSVDKSLIIWDLHLGKKITAFTCDSPAYCCAIAGPHIMAGDQAGRVHFLLLEDRTKNGR